MKTKVIFKRKLYRTIYEIHTPSYNWGYKFEEESLYVNSKIVPIRELIDENETFYECELFIMPIPGDIVELTLENGIEKFTIDKREIDNVNNYVICHVKEDKYIIDELAEESKGIAEKELKNIKDNYNAKLQLEEERIKSLKWYEFWKE